MRVTTRNALVSAAVVGALVAVMVIEADVRERHDGLVRVDTLDEGRIVVSNPDSPPTDARATPTLVEVLRIGSLDGTCDAFG